MQMVANHALGNRLDVGTGKAAAFGAVALPAVLMFPILGFPLTGWALYQSGKVNYHVWRHGGSGAEKRSGALLLIATTAGGYFAARNYQTFGWRNSQAMSQVGKWALLNKNSPLSEWLRGTPDDAYIHLSPQRPATLRSGVWESVDRPGWVRFGDVKHLSAEAFRTEVVGSIAGAHSPKATTFAIRMPNPENPRIFTEVAPDIVNMHGVPEFETSVSVAPDVFMLVPKGHR